MTRLEKMLRSIPLNELAALRRNLDSVSETLKDDDSFEAKMIRLAIDKLAPKLQVERERRARRSKSRREAIRLRSKNIRETIVAMDRLAAHDLTIDLELDPSGRSRLCSRCGATRAEILAGIDCEK